MLSSGWAFYGGAFFAGLVALVAGWRWARRNRRRGLVLLFAALPLLLFKVVLHFRPAWEFALFPYDSYIVAQSAWIYPISLFCLGLGAGLLPRRRTRRACLGLACFWLCWLLWSERHLVVPPDATSTKRADATHHCEQSSPFSCAPAACVSLLSYWGHDATEGEMAALCRTQIYGGTHLFNIVHGLRRKLRGNGLEVRLIGSSLDELRARGLPAMLPNSEHVVCVAFPRGRVVLHDPAKAGPREVGLEELQDIWNGVAIVATPRDA